MSQRTYGVGEYGAQRRNIVVSMPALMALICGLANDVSINVIGEYYLSELLLLPFAIMLLVLKKQNQAIKFRLFALFVLLGGISLVGYMISDMFAGTAAHQYLRGWGRIVILVSNCFALMVVAGQNKQNLWWFMLGTGLGGIAYLYFTDVPINVWKLGYGERVTILFLALVPILPFKLWPLALLAFGTLNMALDYRNVGAALIGVAAVVFVGRMRQGKRLGGLLIAGTVAVAALILTVTLTKTEYDTRRTDSNIGRLSAVVVSLRAIVDSPFLGYGSWTENAQYADEVRKEIEKRRSAEEDSANFHRLRSGSGFQSHSQILQSWVEGGLLGASFFLFFGYQLVRALVWAVLRRWTDVFSPVFLYSLIISLWNFFASPFLGSTRIQIAIAVAVIVVLSIERRRGEAPLAQQPNAPDGQARYQQKSSGRQSKSGR